MKLVFRSSNFVIIDDFLPQEIFQNIWVHVQYENYSLPQQSGSWVKVWRLGDSMPMGSAEYYWSKRPLNNYMDVVGHYFAEAAKSTSDIVGKDWDDIVMRTYLYPRNTKLSWHNDSGSYKAAFTYYIHPKWASTWGGELMICSQTPSFEELEKKPKVGPHLDHEWEDEYILKYGIGQWISPKPNRCVIMLGGTYHAVNRVDADAGDHARCTIVGFLTKAKDS